MTKYQDVALSGALRCSMDCSQKQPARNLGSAGERRAQGRVCPSPWTTVGSIRPVIADREQEQEGQKAFVRHTSASRGVRRRSPEQRRRPRLKYGDSRGSMPPLWVGVSLRKLQNFAAVFVDEETKMLVVGSWD